LLHNFIGSSITNDLIGIVSLAVTCGCVVLKKPSDKKRSGPIMGRNSAISDAFNCGPVEDTHERSRSISWLVLVDTHE
jgi:hypothetical protein